MEKLPKIEAANDYLPVLCRLLDAGLVRLDLDAAHLNLEQSPVTMHTTQTRWLYAFLLATLVAGWLFSGWAAAGVGVAIAVGYWLYQRPRIEQTIRRRIAEEALTDYHRWSSLWRYGGLTLRYDGTISELKKTCVSPTDNWPRFVKEIMNADPHVASALQRHGLD